jgi:xylan 1,4-beta-xylosidase
MGSPKSPTKKQIAQLEKAGQLQTLGKPQKQAVKNGMLRVNISLPRQGISLLKVDWP